MPQAQKRKCSVNFGELISFLSMTEAYSRTSLNHIQDCGRHPQQDLPSGIRPRDEGRIINELLDIH